MDDAQEQIDEWARKHGNEHGDVKEALDVVAFRAVIQEVIGPSTGARRGWTMRWTMQEAIFYLLIVHSFWAPTPMRAFHDFFMTHISPFSADAMCDVVGQSAVLLEQAVRAKWETIALAEVKKYCPNERRCILNAPHLNLVIKGIEKNHSKLASFCEHMAESAINNHVFAVRATYDELTEELSRCGAGFGPYSAAQWMRKFVIGSGYTVPGVVPIKMSGSLYKKAEGGGESPESPESNKSARQITRIRRAARVISS